MKKFSIKQFIASDDYPMVVIVDETGFPLFHPNVYASIKLRSLGRSVSSIEKNLSSIGMLYLWAVKNKIDLQKSLFSSDFFTINQLQDLAYFLRLKRNNQDNLLQGSNLNKKNLSKCIEKIIYKKLNGNKINNSVSAAEVAFRIRSVANFLDFFLIRANHKSDLNSLLKERLKYFRLMAPKVPNKGDQDALEGLSENARKSMTDIFDPQNLNNPFSSDFFKYRNQLIYEILLSTGMRRNELRHLKVDDISYANQLIDIRVSKTKIRTVPCSSDTCQKFHKFVTSYLSKIPIKQRSHNYLFTTETGKHLSNDAINLVFRTARNRAELQQVELTPHTLRRTWNDAFSELIDKLPPEKKIDKELEKQIRNRLMGWSAISEMSEKYARRFIREKSDEIAEQLANEITKNSRNNL